MTDRKYAVPRHLFAFAVISQFANYFAATGTVNSFVSVLSALALILLGAQIWMSFGQGDVTLKDEFGLRK